MLKALTGFTLPDDTRVEANTLIEDDALDKRIVKRLFALGALEKYVEPEPTEESPAPEATEPSPAVSDPTPTSTPDEAPEAATEAQGAEEETDGSAR